MSKLIQNAQFPALRMRRMRKDAFSRAMMREHVVTPADLIYPVFITEGAVSYTHLTLPTKA